MITKCLRSCLLSLLLGREPCGDRILRSCPQKASATAPSNYEPIKFGIFTSTMASQERHTHTDPPPPATSGHECIHSAGLGTLIHVSSKEELMCNAASCSLSDILGSLAEKYAPKDAPCSRLTYSHSKRLHQAQPIPYQGDARPMRRRFLF